MRRLPRGDHHARCGFPLGKSAPPGAARAAGVCRPGAFGCSRYSAIDGTMPRVPPAGVRPVAIGGAQCDLRAAVRGCKAQPEAAVERRLPALPRHAFRRRHTGPGGAGGYQGSVASAAARTGGPAGDPVPELPSGASRGRDVAQGASRESGTPAAKSSAKQELLRPSVSLFDRREQKHFSVDLLSLPAMRDGARAVKISPDTRQALCYQCHAPLAGASWARATTGRRWACMKG